MQQMNPTIMKGFSIKRTPESVYFWKFYRFCYLRVLALAFIGLDRERVI